MMTENAPRHSIDEDTKNNFIRASIGGYWNMPAVEDFERSMRTAVARVGRENGGMGTRLLIDARESVAQSKEVVERLQNLAATLNISRTAVLVNSALVRMQAQRINITEQGVFDNEREALEWVLSPTPD